MQSALTRRGFLHGINGIAQQVDEHLLKHDAITLHLCILMVQLNAQFNGVALEFPVQQSQASIQQGVQIYRLIPGLARLGEFAHAADDAGGVLHLIQRQLHALLQHRQQGRVRRLNRDSCHARLEAAQHIGDGAQRLVQLVRQGSGHFAYSDVA